MKKKLGIVLVLGISLIVAEPRLLDWLSPVKAADTLPACMQCQCKMVGAYAQLGATGNTGWAFYQLVNPGPNQYYANAQNASGSAPNSDQKNTSAWIYTNNCPAPNSTYYVQETNPAVTIKKTQGITNLPQVCNQAYQRRQIIFVEANYPAKMPDPSTFTNWTQRTCQPKPNS